MMHSLRFRAALAAVLLFLGLFSTSAAWAVSVEQVPNPRNNHGWVSDTINILPAQIEADINAKLSALEQETGIEIAVVTVEKVDTPTPKDFATELFNRWQIGKRKHNTGLLILLVRGERRLEMETGYGLESALSDGWLKRMQVEKMVPQFKKERYDLGLKAGVDSVVQRLRQRPLSVTNAGGYDPAEDADETGLWPWLLGLLGLGGGGFGVAKIRSRRKRTCPECKTLMEMIPDGEDNKFLDPGQVDEQSVKSVDYQIYRCKTCDFERRLVLNKWFSGFSTCRECGYKTMKTTSAIVIPATTVSTGLKSITETCWSDDCDYEFTREVIIPRVSTSSSGGGGGGFSSGGGGGGGGSFGGGSSGGGGAGSSW